MADAFMTFMVNFTGYYAILTMTRGGWAVCIIHTLIISYDGMGMRSVMVVFTMADTSVSMVNGADDISCSIVASVVCTISSCGACFSTDCWMWMRCVVMVFTMADTSVSMVNGADDISCSIVASVVGTIGCCGACFSSRLEIRKGGYCNCSKKWKVNFIFFDKLWIFCWM